MSKRAEQLNNVTERRTVALDEFDLRTEGNTLQFKGYASLFDSPYEMYGGPDKGGWMETVDKQAFTRTLSAKPDVVLNMNHGEGGTGLPIARTTSGTMTLRTDAKGLLPEASLDLRDPDVQALQVKVERGDVNQMSFAFRTIRQEWNDEETTRRMMELSLDRGDVSIVTNGANPKTSMNLRGLSDALALITRMDPQTAATEMRALSDPEMSQVSAAHTLLGHLMGMCVEPADDETGGGSGMYSAGDVFEWRAAEKYSDADRAAMAKSGDALPDGSYPIKDQEDLANAIHAVGRGGDPHGTIRKHIMARAKALGLSKMIPSDWNSDGSMKSPGYRSLEVPTQRLSIAQARRLALLDA